MYDARNGSGSGDNPVVFGGAVLAVVLITFLAVWKGPELFSSGGGKLAAERDRLSVAFEDTLTQDMVFALKALDPAGYEPFVASLTANPSQADALENLNAWNLEVFAANFAVIDKIDVKYADEVLRVSVEAMDQLSASKSRYCLGATYVRFQTMSPEALERELMSLSSFAEIPGTPVYDYGIRINTIMLEALVDARRSPKSYGEMTSGDMRKLMAFAQDLMLEPELARLSTGSASSIGKADFCKLGKLVVTKYLELPQSTRGRLWQTGMSRAFEEGFTAALPAAR